MAASREVFRRHSAAMRSSVLVTAGKTKVGYGERRRKARWKPSKTSWRPFLNRHSWALQR